MASDFRLKEQLPELTQRIVQTYSEVSTINHLGHCPLPNFDVIKHYNNSDSYALAVGHLADRIIGGGEFISAWPANDYALNASQKVELQSLLNRRGFNVGTPDGAIGPKTRAAVIAYQQQAGLPADGFVSGRLLDRLKN